MTLEALMWWAKIRVYWSSAFEWEVFDTAPERGPRDGVLDCGALPLCHDESDY